MRQVIRIGWERTVKVISRQVLRSISRAWQLISLLLETPVIYRRIIRAIAFVLGLVVVSYGGEGVAVSATNPAGFPCWEIFIQGDTPAKGTLEVSITVGKKSISQKLEIAGPKTSQELAGDLQQEIGNLLKKNFPNIEFGVSTEPANRANPAAGHFVTIGSNVALQITVNANFPDMKIVLQDPLCPLLDPSADIFNHFAGTLTTAEPWVDIRNDFIRIQTESPAVLTLEMQVHAPIPVQPAAFFASWHFLVDVDGDRSTGHPGYRRPVGVVPDLGVDLWADLLWDGLAFRPMLFLGPLGIPFLIDTPGLLQVTLSEDRTVVTMRIPVDPLEQLFSSLYGRPITIAEQNVKWVAVTNFCETESDCEDPPSDFFPDDLYKPILFLNLNQATFRPGDTLTVQVGARNLRPAYNADFYLGAVLPDGITLVFVTNLSPLTLAIGTLSDPRTFQPLLANVSVPEGFEQVFDNVVSYTFSGGEAQGGYMAFDALARPGVFNDGFNDLGDIQAIDLQPFSVGP